MRIILKQEVDNLGLAGDVVEVADGYARNYLIPRELAIKATRGALKQADMLTRARKAQEAKTLGSAERYREVFESRALRVPVRVDERGHLYGSVGAVEVQKALRERGHDVERKRIDLKHPIKEIGSYTVTVRLHPQVSAKLPIEVVDAEGRVSQEEFASGGEGQSSPEGATAAAEAAGATQPEPGAVATGEGSDGASASNRRRQRASEQET